MFLINMFCDDLFTEDFKATFGAGVGVSVIPVRTI